MMCLPGDLASSNKTLIVTCGFFSARPIALAALRLMTNSYFVGASVHQHGRLADIGTIFNLPH